MTEPTKPGLIISLWRWFLCGVSSALILTACIGLALISRRAAYSLYQQWARLQLRIFRVTVETTRSPLPEDRGFVIVQMNQASLFETFALPPGSDDNPAILINIEYALIPFLGPVMIAFGAVIIIRQWPAQTRRAIKRAVARLRGGRKLFISIEGRRSKTGQLSPYKKGPVLMAIEAQADMVPLFVKGCRERLPWGEWRVRPGHVQVYALDPVSVQGKTYADRHALLEKLEDVANQELGHRPPRRGSKTLRRATELN